MVRSLPYIWTLRRSQLQCCSRGKWTPWRRGEGYDGGGGLQGHGLEKGAGAKAVDHPRRDELRLGDRGHEDDLADEVYGETDQDRSPSAQTVGEEETEDERPAELTGLQASGQDALSEGTGVAKVVEKLWVGRISRRTASEPQTDAHSRGIARIPPSDPFSQP